MLSNKTQLQQSLLLLLLKTRDRGIWLLQKLLYAPTVTSQNTIVQASSTTKLNKFWHILPLLGDIQTGYTHHEVSRHLPYHNYPINFVAQQSIQSGANSGNVTTPATAQPTLYTFFSTPPSAQAMTQLQQQQNIYITSKTSCLLSIHPFVLFSLLSNPMNKPSYDKHCTRVLVHDVINIGSATPTDTGTGTNTPPPVNSFQTITIATFFYTITNWLSTSKRHTHVAMYRGGLCSGEYVILFMHLPLNSSLSGSSTDKKHYSLQEKTKLWPIVYDLSSVPSASHEITTVIEGFVIKPYILTTNNANQNNSKNPTQNAQNAQNAQNTQNAQNSTSQKRICTQLFYFNNSNLKGRGQSWLIDSLTKAKATTTITELRDWLVESRNSGGSSVGVGTAKAKANLILEGKNGNKNLTKSDKNLTKNNDPDERNSDGGDKLKDAQSTLLQSSGGWGAVELALRSRNSALLNQLSGSGTKSENNVENNLQNSTKSFEHLFNHGSYHVEFRAIPRLCNCEFHALQQGQGTANSNNTSQENNTTALLTMKSGLNNNNNNNNPSK
jgi:hypothetical protein